MPDRPADMTPFKSDPDYIEFALTTFLTAKVNRIAAERDLDDAVRHPTPRADRILCRPRKAQPEDAVQTKHLEALAVEAQVTADYKARLEAHQRTEGAYRLGLDRTTEAFGLDEREVLILLALTAPAISQTLAERVLGGLDLRYFAGGMMVENLLCLLDPEGVSQLIEYRRYFHRGSPLCKNELIAVTFHSGLLTPDQFLEGQVMISPTAFGYLLGLSPDFMAEEREAASDFAGGKV